MEANKYFTPVIEDFHVGYLYEEKSNIGGWFKQTFGDSNHEYNNELSECLWGITHGNIRVPYLTKEQIEAEGWNPYGQGNDGGIVYSLFKNSFKVVIWRDYLKIEIQESEGNILFHGECKDINTFKKIIKLLKIN